MRFIPPDTIVPGVGDPQSWNRYAYVLGNPLRYTDPSGHCFARLPNGNVVQTNNTWLDCTFSDIQMYSGDTCALGFWVSMLRQSDSGLEAYLKSDAGAKLASDLGMNGYDGMLALLGVLNGSGCDISSATNLDCSPKKPAPKQNELVNHVVEALQAKAQQVWTPECGAALGAMASSIALDAGIVLAFVPGAQVGAATLITVGLVGSSTFGAMSVSIAAQDGDWANASVSLWTTVAPTAPGSTFISGLSAAVTCIG